MHKYVLTGLFFLCQACAPESSAPAQQNTPNAFEGTSWHAWAKNNPSWVEPISPYHIIDNLYYVGSKGLGAYLVTSERGHILLDGGLPQNGPMIEASIADLGYDIKDVKILLNSHAHFDHSGGLAFLKARSGAKLHASKPDAPWLQNGFYPGAEGKIDYASPQVGVDVVFDDRHEITLGTTTIQARLTPGHSPGCTSWVLTTRHDGKSYEVLIFGSATVAGNTLVPEQYPGIIEDFETTFKKMQDWKPDIVLSNHPEHFFDQAGKMKRKQAGDELAFVDQEIFQPQIRALEQKFRERLMTERNKSKH